MRTHPMIKIEELADRVFLKMATKYQADYSMWVILANKRHQMKRNLKLLKTLLPVPRDPGKWV
jgi:hypothetical protein